MVTVAQRTNGSCTDSTEHEGHPAEALFKEAKRRERRRRLFKAGAAALVLIVVVVAAAAVLSTVGQPKPTHNPAGSLPNHTSGSNTGTVTGTASMCIGPVPTVNTSQMIAVSLQQGRRLVATEIVTSSLKTSPTLHYFDGVFKFRVPPGSYQLNGSSDFGQKVALTSGQTVRVNLVSMCL
jgi:hypothetical protein